MLKDVGEPTQHCFHTSAHWYLGLSYKKYYLFFRIPKGAREQQADCGGGFSQPRSHSPSFFSQEKGLERIASSLFHNIKATTNATKPHQRCLVTKTKLCEAVSIVMDAGREHRNGNIFSKNFQPKRGQAKY